MITIKFTGGNSTCFVDNGETCTVSTKEAFTIMADNNIEING